MTTPAPQVVKVAIVGVGTIGRGWAALSAANGWHTALYDTEVNTADRAVAEVARRARALVAVGRAQGETVEAGLRQVRLGRSLLQACGEADWIIESVKEDLSLKQRVFDNIDQVARPDAVISSSSSGLPITEIASRCRDQSRCIVAHSLNPPELIPLVEVVPGKFTAPATTETVRGWLRTLGRIPITLKREVPGNAVGRISAAVWRECIDLVLSGVMDVDDIDRAVSLGPGLGWAAAGPHLTYHLGAGEGGVNVFLQQLLMSFETWWGSLAQWTKLEPEQVRALTSQIERAYGDKLETIREARDRRLAAILKGLEAARKQ
ncbi:MAG: 3-hydroxyacyl-CoA dehydrogenase NAD-binding domain-containing protein [Gemmatimonadales bacterium]|nr:3-hydroxyacyl-CoA dehydrogenase NAD-binding domain-containing protein [Gemmatimonadales bacterium]